MSEGAYESAGKVDACGSSVRAVQPLRLMEAEKAMIGNGHVEETYARCCERSSLHPVDDNNWRL